jgi:rubredoxin
LFVGSASPNRHARLNTPINGQFLSVTGYNLEKNFASALFLAKKLKSAAASYCIQTLIQNMTETKTLMCLICGWIYDEATGDSEHGLLPGTRWEDVPMNWTCPECGARKEDFEMVEV